MDLSKVWRNVTFFEYNFQLFDVICHPTSGYEECCSKNCLPSGYRFFFSNCGSFLSSLTLPFAAFKSGEGRKAKPAELN